MLYFRVFPWLPDAKTRDKPGHPEHVPTGQGKGRIDNPEHYAVSYLAEEAAGAVAEAFGDLHEWTDGMFSFPGLGARRALGVYELSGRHAVLDLDDAQHLLDRGLRPSEVVGRDRGVTQAWALSAWKEKRGPRRRWAGVRWWSVRDPSWHVCGVWSGDLRVVDIEVLALDHPAVVEAARILGRRLA